MVTTSSADSSAEQPPGTHPTVAEAATIRTRIGRFVPDPATNRHTSTDVFVSSDNSLVVLADGLGRNISGDASASTVIRSLRTLARRVRSNPNREQARMLINLALVQCNAALLGHSRRSRGHAARGASVMIALRVANELIVKSVGDCRCYLLRGEALQPVTHDHTLTELLVSTGGSQTAPQDITPNRGVLRHIGQHDYVPNNEFGSISLATGDRVLFCTRGVTSVVTDSDIEGMLSQAATPAIAARKIACRALDQGASSTVASATIFVGAQHVGPPT